MTKNEFRLEAGKAGIPSELYGAVIHGQLHSTYGTVSGGKIVGIEWFDKWETTEEYNYIIGVHKTTALRKAPYVVLMKNRKKYLVEAWKVKGYVDRLFRKWLDEKLKAKEPL